MCSSTALDTREFAKIPFPAHPHMLRYACGFKLASDGQGKIHGRFSNTSGHRNITHTVRYTEFGQTSLFFVVIIESFPITECSKRQSHQH